MLCVKKLSTSSPVLNEVHVFSEMQHSIRALCNICPTFHTFLQLTQKVVRGHKTISYNHCTFECYKSQTRSGSKDDDDPFEYI